jgi:uncharacterized coiled-coil DUF342 family protein
MMMTERKYPTRDSGPMYNFPMPTETLRAELAEARGIVFDLDEELSNAKSRIYAVTEELRKTKTELYDMKRERDKMRSERDKLLYDTPPKQV